VRAAYAQFSAIATFLVKSMQRTQLIYALAAKSHIQSIVVDEIKCNPVETRVSESSFFNTRDCALCLRHTQLSLCHKSLFNNINFAARGYIARLLLSLGVWLGVCHVRVLCGNR